MMRVWLISFLIILNVFSQSSAETDSINNQLSSQSSQDISSLALSKEGQKINHPLPVDQAFDLSAVLLDNNILIVRWLVQPDYYLYKDKISFSFDEASVEQITFPNATIKNDEFFGEVRVYNTPLEIQIELNNVTRIPVFVTIEHQGCWEGGVCYPPQVDRLEVSYEGSKKAPVPATEMVTDLESKVSETFQHPFLYINPKLNCASACP